MTWFPYLAAILKGTRSIKTVGNGDGRLVCLADMFEICSLESLRMSHVLSEHGRMGEMPPKANREVSISPCQPGL